MAQPSFFDDFDGAVNPNYNDPYANLPDLSHFFDRNHYRRQLLELARNRDNQEDQWQWNVGDLLVLGEVFGRLNDEELRSDTEQITKLTKRSWQTLKNYKVVSRAFPKSSSLRRDGLPFSLYTMLTKFHDLKDKEKALDRAEELKSQKRLTVKGFENEIERMQRHGQLPQDGADSKPHGEDSNNGTGEQNGDDKKRITVEGTLKQDTLERLETVAFARYEKHQANRLIWEMAFKYWGDHKEQLESMSKSDDPKLKHPNPLP
jgi:hypothetical protein